MFQYTLESDSRDLMELRTLQDWVLRPILRTVPGVAGVDSFGGWVRQFHVVVAPERLARYDLALGDVVAALEANNRNVGGGVVTVGGQASLVHGVGRVGTVEDIAYVGPFLPSYLSVAALMVLLAGVCDGLDGRRSSSARAWRGSCSGSSPPTAPSRTVTLPLPSIASRAFTARFVVACWS